jgi:hypothetical protein
VELRSPQDLVRVDVPQTSQETLIEQQGLQPGSSVRKHLPQLLGREVLRQWFRSQFAQHFIRIGCENHPTELARVGEPEPSVVVEEEQYAGVLACWSISRLYEQSSRHTQVDQEVRAPLQEEVHPLPSPAHPQDLPTLQMIHEGTWLWGADRALPAHIRANYPPPGELLQAAGDYLHFG